MKFFVLKYFKKNQNFLFFDYKAKKGLNISYQLFASKIFFKIVINKIENKTYHVKLYFIYIYIFLYCNKLKKKIN